MRLPYLLLAAAIANLIYGAFRWREIKRRQVHWSMARGDVIELEERWDAESTSTFCPHVRFRTETGNEFTFTNSCGLSKPDSYLVGERVDVLYDPDNPNHAVINDWSSMWAMVAIAFLLGVFFGVIAWVSW